MCTGAPYRVSVRLRTEVELLGSSINLQERFLLKMRKLKVPVCVFLANGVRVEGRITGYDQFTVLVDAKGRQMQIFKSAITTIVGPGNIDIFSQHTPLPSRGPRSRSRDSRSPARRRS